MKEYSDKKLQKLKEVRKSFFVLNIIFLLVFLPVIFGYIQCSKCHYGIPVLFLFLNGLWVFDYIEARTFVRSIVVEGEVWKFVYGIGKVDQFTKKDLLFINTHQTTPNEIDEVVLTRKSGQVIRLSGEIENLQELVETLDSNFELRAFGYQKITRKLYYWLGIWIALQALGATYFFYKDETLEFYIILLSIIADFFLFGLIYKWSKANPTTRQTV